LAISSLRLKRFTDGSQSFGEGAKGMGDGTPSGNSGIPLLFADFFALQGIRQRSYNAPQFHRGKSALNSQAVGRREV
jgi:hypothetical protein